jgi:hypothetical protein
MRKNMMMVMAFLVGLGTMVLAGCATSMIYDKSVPMKEQCVIVNADDISTIDGKAVVDMSGWNTAAVYPAGTHTVVVKSYSRYTVSSRQHGDYTYTSYLPYTLKSYTTFEFKPGKRYVIENIYPRLSYDGRTLVTRDEQVTITTSPDGAVYVDNPGLVIREKGTMPFSTHIGLESQINLSAGLVYQDQLSGTGGPRLGVSIIHGGLHLRLMGEAGIGLGFCVPDLAGFGMGFSAYYGGTAEIVFSKVALELGGGMIAGINTAIDYDAPLFSTPYLQAGILFRKPGKTDWGLYGQYYLNGEEWRDTYGVGMKWHFY